MQWWRSGQSTAARSTGSATVTCSADQVVPPSSVAAMTTGGGGALVVVDVRALTVDRPTAQQWRVSPQDTASRTPVPVGAGPPETSTAVVVVVLLVVVVVDAVPRWVQPAQITATA